MKTEKVQKKLLYCDSNIDGTVGGAYYSLYYLAEGLDKDLYDPMVVFYKHNPLISVYRNAGIKTTVIAPPKPIHITIFRNGTIQVLGKITGLLQSTINFSRFFGIEAFKFAIYLKKNHIDLVHLNNSVNCNHNWMLAAKIAGVKCVSHERRMHNHYSHLAHFFTNRLDAIVCISDAVRHNMENCGLKNANLVTIYNGLDPNRVQVTREPTKIRSSYYIENHVPLIGIVGNIKSWKGQDVVVKATAEVKKLYPDIKCLIIGDNADSDKDYLHHVQQVVKDAGVSDSIIFTGFQINVADYINALDIVIHASTLGEPFGRVLLEAMALEKPLIGSRDGAVPEIIDEPNTGLMFKPGDHEDLAHSIIKLLNNPEMAKEMGRKGRERLINNFHISRNIDSTQQLYQSILS